MAKFVPWDYDYDSDVMYVSMDRERKDEYCTTEETDLPRVLLRFTVGDDKLIGATILDYAGYWQKQDRIGELAVYLTAFDDLRNVECLN